MMKVLVTHDDGDREIVCGDTWLDIVRQVACTTISLVAIEDAEFSGKKL